MLPVAIAKLHYCDSCELYYMMYGWGMLCMGIKSRVYCPNVKNIQDEYFSKKHIVLYLSVLESQTIATEVKA